MALPRYLILTAIGIVLSACGNSTEPGPASRADPSGLRITVDAVPTRLNPGQSMTIRLRIENPGNDPITRAFASGCITGYGIHDRGGTMVEPSYRICTQNAPVVTYAPGQVVEVEYQWTWEESSLGPGRYEVVGGLGPYGELESGPPVEIVLASS